MQNGVIPESIVSIQHTADWPCRCGFCPTKLPQSQPLSLQAALPTLSELTPVCGVAGSEVSSPTAKPLDRTPSSSVLQASASERSFRNPGEEAQAAEYARQVRAIQLQG